MPDFLGTLKHNGVDVGGGSAVDKQVFSLPTNPTYGTITQSVLASGLRSTAATTASGNTASVTCTANRLLLLFIATNGSAGNAATVSSVSGLGLSWVIHDTGNASVANRVQVAYAIVPAGGGATGQVTINLATTAGTGTPQYTLIQVAGCDLIAPIKSTATAASGSASSQTVAFTSMAVTPAANRVFAGFAGSSAFGGMFPGTTGYVELAEATSGSVALETEWHPTAKTPSLTVVASASASMTAIAVEVAASPPTTTFTWTKPAGATQVRVRCIGAGGGGGAGYITSNGQARYGGGGGASGGIAERLFTADELNATEQIGVGVGGGGGLGQDATGNSNRGADGGSSWFKDPVAFIYANGGGGGSGGSISGGSAGIPGATTTPQSGGMGYGLGGNQGSNGASGTGTAGLNQFVNTGGPSGGGGGGMTASTDTPWPGGAGGAKPSTVIGGPVTGAAGGATAGAAGADGAAVTGEIPGMPGAGGASGGTGNGGKGGNGTGYGAPGGGGGSANNGLVSGSGGNGSHGVVVVWSW